MSAPSPPFVRHIAAFTSPPTLRRQEHDFALMTDRTMKSHSTEPLPPLSGYLFTPPENMADSFSKDGGRASTVDWQTKLAPIQRGAPSPPITPETRTLGSFDAAHDVPLFPARDSQESPNADTPLFDTASQGSSPRQASSRPTTATSQSDRSPRGNLGGVIGPGVYIENSSAGVRKYYFERMAELNRLRTYATLPPPTTSTGATRDLYSTRQLQSLGKPVGITKPKALPSKMVVKAKAAKVASSAPAVKATTPKRTPKAAILKDFSDNGFAPVQAPKHKRAAPSKKVEGKEEDKKWRELPDFAPPLSSLASAPKPLKADWKAEPKDLSHEVDVDALGSEEYALASGLRLLPQQYLANKRRMFQARLQHLKDGKNFTKTAAQLACNIDVNKASALWEAFNRVGWFRETWFEQFV